MKKSLACILVFLVLLALSATALAAKPGDTVTVSVSVTANPSHAFSGQIGFKFDESALEFVSAASSGSDTVMYPTSAKGYFLLQNLSGITTGTKGTITLKVKDGAAAGTYDVTAYAHDFIDVDENPVSVSVASGSVTVEATACTHTWNDGKVTREPTCEEAGVMTYTCTKCKQTKTEPVKALNHDKTETITKEATCGADGEKTTTCSRCDFKKTEKIPATGKHTYGEGKVTKEPTCTAEGVMSFTCSVCSGSKTEKINAKGHEEKLVAGKEPTCTEDGLTDGKQCSVCNEITVKQNAIPAKGHTAGEWVVVKEPAKEEDGLKEKRCKVCGELLESARIPLNQVTFYTDNTACSVGPCFRDETTLTTKWYRFTPVDLSVEGTQTFDLVASNLYIIGKVNVTVQDGQVTVECVYAARGIQVKDEFCTFLPSLHETTTLDQSQLKHYPFGEAVSIADDLAGDTKVLLFICNVVDYNTGMPIELLPFKTKQFKQQMEDLKLNMD